MATNLAAAIWTLSVDVQPSSGSSVPKSCESRHSVMELSLSLFICLGLIVSYLPQIVRIIVKRSSVGFSPWFLFLGATSSASSFLNVLSLQWAVVSCCQWLSYGACAESLLGIAQVALQWFMFMTVSVLFIIYYPKGLRYERAIVLQGEQQALLANARHLEDEGVEDDESSNGDLDSMDSHIASNYIHQAAVNDEAAENSAYDVGAVSGLTTQTDGSGGDDSALASRLDVDGDDERSSSAFSRLVPTFWPVWKAPPKKYSPSPLSKVAATEPAPPSTLLQVPSHLTMSSTNTPSAGSGSATPDIADPEAEANHRRVRGNEAAHVRIAAPEVLRKPLRKRKVKTRSQEWSLAMSLAWIVLIHFVFVLLVTLLLVSSLPSSAFPPPPKGNVTSLAPSSRLLVDRWAAFLGWSAMILAAFQYLPQIVYTARMKLVGSLSIPMMCLQVPGSIVFVYSLALKPGINFTSLAAYICTGVLQAVLLGMCIAWRLRQKRLGIDDYGRPLE
jgi:uncharacterized protein with PQ loop repeat